MKNQNIHHSVIFSLKKGMSETEKELFFLEVKKLIAIEGIKKFKIRKQTSLKNQFEYGISMEFESNTEYQFYNTHPIHVAFVKDIWLQQVEDFLEIDYEDFL